MRISLMLMVLSATFSFGCQTERVTSSDGWRLPPPPKAAPQPASTLRADRMFFSVGSKPDDSNNNGYPDSISVSVALFSSQHPTALQQEGSFVFTMYPQGGVGTDGIQPIREWRIPADIVRTSLGHTFAGPCYLFTLSLMDDGTDRLPLSHADLVCLFEPTDGQPPVKSDGVRTIQVGRRAAN